MKSAEAHISEISESITLKVQVYPLICHANCKLMKACCKYNRKLSTKVVQYSDYWATIEGIFS